MICLGQIWKLVDFSPGDKILLGVITGYVPAQVFISLKSLLTKGLYSSKLTTIQLQDDYELYAEPKSVVVKGLKIGQDIYAYSGENWIHKINQPFMRG